MRKMSAVFMFFVVCLLPSSPARAQTGKWTASFFGGVNLVQEYGTVDDYEMGENDFPVTPAHNPPCFGMSLGYAFINNLRFEADVRYHLSSSLTLEDPSDGDHISFDSTKHLTLTGNFVYEFLSGNLSPYLAAGFGFDTIMGAEEETLTSELGYEIILAEPESKTALAFNGGVGAIWMFDPKIGARIDARYVHIAKAGDLPATSSFNFTAGLVLKF